MQQFTPLIELSLASRLSGVDAPSQIIVENSNEAAEPGIIGLHDRPVFLGQARVETGADDLQSRRDRGMAEGIEKIVDDALRQTLLKLEVVDRSAILSPSGCRRFDHMQESAFFAKRPKQIGLDAAAARPLAQAIIADAELIAKPAVVLCP